MRRLLLRPTLHAPAPAALAAATLLAVCLALPAAAQHGPPPGGHAGGHGQAGHGHGGHGQGGHGQGGHGVPAAPSATPYAGLEQRPVKALSARDIADLRAGRGMGLALAAELNSYPGPLHALELADALGLDAPRRAAVETLFRRMQADAIAAGEAVIGAETALDRLFAERRADEAALEAATAAVGAARARLQAVHLRAHIAMAGLLTTDEIARYDRLRGYAPRPN